MSIRLCLLVVALLISSLGACADIDPPTARQAADPQLQADTFVAADGMRLPLSVWLPHGPVRAVLVAAHGMNDYRLAWARPAARWAEAGIATYAYDQRGFGSAGLRGAWYGAETLGADLNALARLVMIKHPGVPIFMIGESMGGAVAVVAATRPDARPVDGVILSAPAIWGSSPQAWLLRQFAEAAGAMLPDLTVPPRGILPPASDDPTVMDSLHRDPMVIHDTRLETLAGVVDLMDLARRRARGLYQPTLVLLGDDDMQISRAAIARLVEDRPSAVLALYPSAPHLLFRSLGGAGPITDVAAWIVRPGAPLPSGSQARGERCRDRIVDPHDCPAALTMAATPH